MYVLALSLRGVLAGKPVCERHLRSLTTSLPERFGVSGPEAGGDMALFLAQRCTRLSGIPFSIQATPKPCRSPLGLAWGPAMPARAM